MNNVEKRETKQREFAIYILLHEVGGYIDLDKHEGQVSSYIIARCALLEFTFQLVYIWIELI